MGALAALGFGHGEAKAAERAAWKQEAEAEAMEQRHRAELDALQARD